MLSAGRKHLPGVKGTCCAASTVSAVVVFLKDFCIVAVCTLHSTAAYASLGSSSDDSAHDSVRAKPLTQTALTANALTALTATALTAK